MKRVSKFAMTVAMAALSVTVTSPVWAADEKPKKEKKGKAEEAPAALKVNLSKEFKAVYDPVVNVYLKSAGKTKDAAGVAATAAAATTASASWDAMKAAIKSEDDKYQAGVFGQQIGNEAKNEAMRSEAVDLVIASAFTPTDVRTTYVFQKAATAYDTKDWVNAETLLIQAHNAGYKSVTIAGGVEMLIADSLNMQKKYPQSLEWMQKSLDASKQPGAKALPDNFYPRAANVAIRSGDAGAVAKWMRELVNSNPTADYWHDALMQTYKYADLDSQEVLDLMRLLRTVGGMKYEQNYSAYATDALIAFFPTEMKAVLDEGFAKGTISKTNATFGGRYNDTVEKLKIDGFSLTVLDQDIASAKTGASSAFAGDIALSLGEFARAKAAYEAALGKGAIVDKEGKDLSERTIMRLGIAKLKLGDVAGAKAEFAKVSAPGRKSVADYWLLYAEHMEKGIAATAS
jgi:tetratricopeptide (TPR) repeat protein